MPWHTYREPILQPAITAVQNIFQSNVNSYDMIGLYSLGDGWIFKPQLKHGNEQALLSKIAGANEVTGNPHLNPSLLECLAELQNIPSYVGRWLVTLSDTVDLEYGERNSTHNPNCNNSLLVLASNTSSQERPGQQPVCRRSYRPCVGGAVLLCRCKQTEQNIYQAPGGSTTQAQGELERASSKPANKPKLNNREMPP